MRDADHPFFRPLWRRIAIVAVCAIWGTVEYVHGQQLWGTIAFGFAAYGAWQFLLNYKPSEPAQPAAPDEKE